MTATPDNDETIRTLVFTLTRDDIARVERLPRPLSTRVGALLMTAWFVLCALLGVFSDTLAPVFGWAGGYQALVMVIAAAALCALAGHGVATLQTNARIRKVPAPTTETQVDLSVDRLMLSQPGGARAYPWTEVREVIYLEDRLLIVATPDHVVTLPLRAFRDAADMRTVCQLIELLVQDDEDEVDDAEEASGTDNDASHTEAQPSDKPGS